jgi:hypothetical protein
MTKMVTKPKAVRSPFEIWLSIVYLKTKGLTEENTARQKTKKTRRKNFPRFGFRKGNKPLYVLESTSFTEPVSVLDKTYFCLIIFIKSSNKYLESCGPGADSG